MTASGTSSSAGTDGRRGRAPGGRGGRRRTAVAATAVLGLALAGCASGPGAAAPAGSSSATPAAAGPGPAGSASPSVAADALTIDVTESNGDVDPNGQKLDVRVGQQVVLNVTSDVDDEIHAHTGGDGYELEVRAGQPATGTFALDSAGSFEVESHHLEKVIVILEAR